MSSVIRSKLISLSILSLVVGISQINLVQAQTFQTIKISQSNQDFQRYLVYVDSDNLQTLEQVRRLESGAYMRSYNGHNVIQSGVFSQQFNAQEQARRLELNGIHNVRMITFSNTEEKASNSGQGNYQTAINNYSGVNNSHSYYVVIPSTDRNLPNLAEQIRQRIGQNSNVFLRTKPRGAHVAVGPFSQHLDAEQWNKYLQKSGYSNARVYYGQ
jgi:hypothetical protein